MNDNNLADYQDIFGDLDFKQGDESRSVYSPAAYLADLLQLMDDEFSDGKKLLDNRRKGIRTTLLNEENTYTQVPYLSIVNEVLKEKIGGDTYGKKLPEAKYPFNTPFELSEEECQLYLKYLGITPESLYKLFATSPKEDILVREALGLSPKEWKMLTTVAKTGKKLDYYGSTEPDIKKARKVLANVNTFMNKTGLTSTQLRELITLNLGEEEKENTRNTPKNFYINLNMEIPESYVKFDKNEENLIVVKYEKNSKGEVVNIVNNDDVIPSEIWFERTNRFIRLAQKTKTTFTDLNLVLSHDDFLNRSRNDNEQVAAIKKYTRLLAVAKKMQKEFTISMDEVMALITKINEIGQGNEEQPTDLFNRVFNNKCIKIDRHYINGSVELAHQFNKPEYNELTYTDDLFSSDNEYFRKRISHALNLPKNGLEKIIQKLRQKDVDSSLWLKKVNKMKLLNFLYRFTRLSSALDISHEALFTLFDLISYDHSLKAFTHNKTFLEFKSGSNNCYEIFLRNNLNDTLWLFQSLQSITQWMKAHDFSADQLWTIATGQFANKKIEDESNRQLVSRLNALYQAFKPLKLGANTFKNAVVDERFAQVIYRNLATLRKTDNVHKFYLADADSQQSKILARTALEQLEKIGPMDFIGLGIEENLVEKIARNLYYRGFVNNKGVIFPDRLPEDAEDFALETDFSEYTRDLFELMHGLYQEAAEKTEADEPVQFSLYPSDLINLVRDKDSLTDEALQELYDNLIFNYYIDQDGLVLFNAFFSQPDNYRDFDTNTHINELSGEVYQRLRDQLTQFEQASTTINPSALHSLDLAESELHNLIENLRFNQYLDEDNQLQSKTQLLHESIDEFKLSLPFFNHRQSIFSLLKRNANSLQQQYLSLDKSALALMADKVISRWAFEDLQHHYLSGEAIRRDAFAFFSDLKNKDNLVLGYYFEKTAGQAVFKRMQRIIKQVETYRLNEKPLIEMKFYPEEIERLFAQLTKMDCLTERHQIPEQRIDYFMDSNNIIDFSIPGFEDFNKEIFFLLQSVAKTTNTVLTQIASIESDLANQQQKLLFNHLRNWFGLNEESMSIISHAFFSGQQAMMQAWLLPLFDSVDAFDAISELPTTPEFLNAIRRIRQFALLANKLQLDSREIDIAFFDQDLVAKFPENLVLPKGVGSIDAILETEEFLYLFNNNHYWIYRYPDYELIDGSHFDDIKEQEKAEKYQQDDEALREQLRDDVVRKLFAKEGGTLKVDAAFTDKQGNYYIVSDGHYFVLLKGTDTWHKRENAFGLTDEKFDHLPCIDAAFTDDRGRLFLFARGRYVRYSNAADSTADNTYVDKGYPKSIRQDWKNEGIDVNWPEVFGENIDAAFHGHDGEDYFFKGNQFISSKDNVIKETANHWGRVKHDLQRSDKIDASYTEEGATYLFVKDLVHKYVDCLEHQQIRIADGYPKTITEHFSAQNFPALPEEFTKGVDAAFKGDDGKIHLFKDQYSISFDTNTTEIILQRLSQQWGQHAHAIQGTERLSAALTALDGRTYIFSGDYYYRYSTGDYTQFDEGYPRLIADDWKGLEMIDAAFVLDGKTYLFGKKQGSGKAVYLRYSTPDYKKLDQIEDSKQSDVKPIGNIVDVEEFEEFPRQQDDQFWSLPDSLTRAGFTQVDAVLNTLSDKTLLFSGNKVVEFDQMHRWWSEPKTLRQKWPGIPFSTIDAAFAGKDGKTYLFENDRYICFSDPDLCHLVDEMPSLNSQFWQAPKNNIQLNERVDAALVVTSRILAEDAGIADNKQQIRHTYLFSGDQFFRYKAADYSKLEPGYPKALSKLHEEPRFKQLKAEPAVGIDAGFSDERNLYLFKGKDCYVVSEEDAQNYDKPAFHGIAASHFEMGRVYVCYALPTGGIFSLEGGLPNSQWYRLSAAEGEGKSPDKGVLNQHDEPEIFQHMPDFMKENLTAILKGVDGNHYFFAGSRCYNHLLDKDYFIDKEWGRYRNNILQHGQIDAGFVGRDRKTYVFSGDQCFTYSNLADITNKPELDEPPKTILARWGLNDVACAFVWKEKTYLFEKANSYGQARYLVFETDNYQLEKPQLMQSEHPCLWSIPDAQKQAGFADFDTMYVEGDNALFIKGQHFIRYHIKSGNWSYPKELSLLYTGLVFNKTTFKKVTTAFAGGNDEVYFFDRACFVCWQNDMATADMPVKDYWGLLNNPLAGGVDATLVHEGKTYLFYKNQYVRYSSPDYRQVDEGYPKQTNIELTKEYPFSKMGKEFQYALDKLAKADNAARIRGIHTNQRNTYVFLDDKLFVGSNQLTARFGTRNISKTDNNFTRTGIVDAAVLLKEDHSAVSRSYLFSGDQYIRYSSNHYDYIDAGYPKRIQDFISAEGFIGEPLPEKYAEGIDTALLFKEGFLITKGGDSWNLEAGLQNITWGRVKNRFQEALQAHDKHIDGAYTDESGRLYVFKDDQYIRYSDTRDLFSDNKEALRYIDAGYPMELKDHQAHLPVAFFQPDLANTGQLDSVFAFENRLFFVKANEYLSYQQGANACHLIRQPVKFTDRFTEGVDYLLNDIYLLNRFKDLNTRYSGADISLTELLDRSEHSKEPYFALSEIFGFAKEDIRWLKEKNVFLTAPTNNMERRFNIEMMIRLYDTLSITQKLNVSPSVLYDKVWKPLYLGGRNALKASVELKKLLGGQDCDDNYVTLFDQIEREINTLKRDVLVPYAVAYDSTVNDARDLYEKLLVDVQMESEASTSKIKEATMALQLFFHRYFIGLESATLSGVAESSRDLLKDQWQWMQNYRVWEANRKVFLYPENYIRPELRDSKTSPFKILEQELNQNEINDDSMQRLFKKYLDEYTEVSRLKVAGGYLFDETSEEDSNKINKKLVLFAHTKSDPVRYYYRFGNFLGGETQNDSWEPWLPVNIPIEATRVYPIFVFGRVFVFWAKIEMVADDNNQSSTFKEEVNGSSKTYEKTNEGATSTVKIYFSYYNLNKDWIQPQQLKTAFEKDEWGGVLIDELKTQSGIDNVQLSVEHATKLNGEAHENIRITCQYKQKDSKGDLVQRVFALTPELYSRLETIVLAELISHEPGKNTFLRLFDEGAIEEKNIVSLNTVAESTDTPWFGYEHKGGGFLCKPDTKALTAANKPQAIASNPFSLPESEKIAAAFYAGNKSYYFSGNQYFTVDDAGTRSVKQDSQPRWGMQGPDLYMQTATAAFTYNNQLYLFDGEKQCIRYDSYGKINMAISKGFPIANNFKAVLNKMGFVFDSVTIDSTTTQIIDPNDYFITAAFNKSGNLHFSVERQIDRTHLNLLLDTTTKTISSAPFMDGRVITKWDAGFSYPVNGVSTDYGFLAKMIYFEYPTKAEDVGRRISAAFSEPKVDGKIYLFSDKEYITLPKKDYTRTELVTAIRNWESQAPKQINGRWLKKKALSEFETKEIKAAYVDGNNLYLLNSMQYQCFEINLDGSINRYPKAGYPQRLAGPLQASGGVDSAFQLDEPSVGKATYLLKGDNYYRYTSGQEPLMAVSPEVIGGNLGNIPKAFRRGITAALNRKEQKNNTDIEALYLFQQGSSRADDQFVRYSNDTAMPYSAHSVDYEIVRLTSSTAKALNEKLFSKGINGLLQVDTQQLRETPTFERGASTATNIQVKSGIAILPDNDSLDFASANGMYYWEIFFHLPFLIAQRLNSEQKFEQARRWYEHIYDPAMADNYWKFLPFADNKKASLIGQLNTAIAKSAEIQTLFDLDSAKFGEEFLLLNQDYTQASAHREAIASRINRVLEKLSLASGLKTLLTKTKGRLENAGYQGNPLIIDSLSELTNIKQDIAAITDSKARNDVKVVVNHLRYRKLGGLIDVANQKLQAKTSEAENLMEPEAHWALWEKFLAILLKQKDRLVSFSLLQTIEACFNGIKAAIQATQQQAFYDLKKYINDIAQRKPPSVILNGDELARLEQTVAGITGDTAVKFLEIFGLIKWLYAPDQLAKSAVYFVDKIPAPHKADFEYFYKTVINNFQLLNANPTSLNKYLDTAIAITQTQTTRIDGKIDADYNRGKAISDDIANVISALSAVEGVIDGVKFTQTSEQQLAKYLHDPFDPHAIAGLRPIAYKKAIVMSYIDNLLDWGDMLFRQYTRESINEARMLYVLAYDLLGKKPENLGRLILSEAKSYAQLNHFSDDNNEDYDFLFDLENTQPPSLRYESLTNKGTMHDSIINPYFHIPENHLFTDYWTRVEDRLHKIRHSLNLDGQKQPLPLFQPPIDPMALVKAVAAGGSIGEALSMLAVNVPHHRFSYMLEKAKAYTDKLSQFGGDLLAAIEKKETEELELLQNQQEATILQLNRQIKGTQIKEAKANIKNLEESLASAKMQKQKYLEWRERGLIGHEQTQIDLNIASTTLMGVSGLLKIGAAIAYGIPEIHVGPFIFGSSTGGKNVGDFLEKHSDALETTGDALSTGGEIAAIYAQNERSREEWGLQEEIAAYEIKQIEQQLIAAKLQLAIAQREQQIHEQEIRHNLSTATFMKNKFSNQQLYQWMGGQLSSLYYQGYKMAHDIAKQAEKAFQFETGTREQSVNYISGSYWDSQRKGLMSGERLGNDLAAMEKAYMEQDKRGLEITKNISLLEMDPLAYMELKAKGSCTFRLTEALFDYDFPGHYNRQIKSISLAFDMGEGKDMNATLIQLNNHLLMEPDIKGVKHLLEPKGDQPLSIRSDWRANQQVALSHVDQYTENNGLFELRYDDERYLPFEGTGAVSLWRLEINGKRGSYNPNEMLDVTIKLRYTAEQGGEAFDSAVRGALKPYRASAFMDLAYSFPNAWQAFMESDEKTMKVKVPRSLFPNMSSSRLEGVFTRYEFVSEPSALLVLNDEHKLANERYLEISNLNVARNGSEWTFTVQGDKKQLKNVELILIYKAKL